MEREIKQTLHFRQPPQEVWDYLTKPELLAQWLMDTDFKPIVGHKFTFTCNAVHYCEVLEVTPFKRLVYSWQANSLITGQPFTSRVVWTLVPKGKGTELQLVHNGFTTLEDALAHEDGWGRCGEKIIQLSNPVKHA
jgi:uncharacterized protein YndB with AHSA1/START domain